MKSAILRFLKLRLFLILAALAIIALIVSTTWGHGTSYDDGGVGSAAFLVMALLSIPGKLLGLRFLGGAMVFIALCIALDLLVAHRLKRP